MYIKDLTKSDILSTNYFDSLFSKIDEKDKKDQNFLEHRDNSNKSTLQIALQGGMAILLALALSTDPYLSKSYASAADIPSSLQMTPAIQRTSTSLTQTRQSSQDVQPQ